MMDFGGSLVVFEGIDGSGKSTQFDMMCTHLAYEGKGFKRIRFPRYDEPSAALLKMYLNGEFGSDPKAVNPYAASAFFMVDRIASYLTDWKDAYEGGGLVVADRYTTSNAVHQGAKMSYHKRETFFKWLYEYEFNLIELPKPNIVIYLDIEAKYAAKRISKRQEKTGSKGDIHEQSIAYLEKCAECGKQAADYYGWKKLDCYDGERERTQDEIHKDVREIFAAL